MQKIISQIASELNLEMNVNLEEGQVLETIRLLDSGNTIPFIARYRKEITGGLNEDQLRSFSEKLSYLRKLEARKWEVIKLISLQRKLTKQLKRSILKANNLKTVDDLYLPFKPKRRTRASVAREKGLEPLAQLVLSQADGKRTLDEHAAPYIDSAKDLKDTNGVFTEAKSIIAEIISEDAEIREMVRQYTKAEGYIVSQISPTLLETNNDKPNDKTDPNREETENNSSPELEKETPKDRPSIKNTAITRKYKYYLDYTKPIANVNPQTVLMLNQGEKEKALIVKVVVPTEKIISNIEAKYIHNPSSIFIYVLKDAIADSYRRLLAPSIEKEVRRELTQMANRHVINATSKRLRELLLKPPIRNKRILTINPTYRMGCKVAVLNDAGDPIIIDTIYPHHSLDEWQDSKDKLCNLILEHNVDLIAIGSGAASREAEALAAEVISELNGKGEAKEMAGDTYQRSDEEKLTLSEGAQAARMDDLAYIMVNEAGAFTYSISHSIRDEFSDLDADAREAISIGRQLQDPLAELVKIGPKLIGKATFQYGVSLKELGSTLNAVVKSCVNYVGVDLNTASLELLRNVSGLERLTAQKIIEKREKIGRFTSREQLKEVDGISEHIYTQAAGFLRIADGDNPLDNTAIHPESYAVCKELLNSLNMGIDDLRSKEGLETLRKSLSELSVEEIAPQLNVGVPTLRDIFESITKPGYDPRENLPSYIFKRNVLTMANLRPGMKIKGTVRSMVDFGVFVDIGVKRDGLIHVSELADGYVENPQDVVSVGDIVEVKVLSIDREKERIKLTLRSNSSEAQHDERHATESFAKAPTKTDEKKTAPTASELPDRRPAPRPEKKRESKVSKEEAKPQEDRKPKVSSRRTPKDSSKRSKDKHTDSNSRDNQDESTHSSGQKLKDTPEWRSLLQKFGL